MSDTTHEGLELAEQGSTSFLFANLEGALYRPGVWRIPSASLKDLPIKYDATQEHAAAQAFGLLWGVLLTVFGSMYFGLGAEFGSSLVRGYGLAVLSFMVIAAILKQDDSSPHTIGILRNAPVRERIEHRWAACFLTLFIVGAMWLRLLIPNGLPADYFELSLDGFWGRAELAVSLLGECMFLAVMGEGLLLALYGRYRAFHCSRSLEVSADEVHFVLRTPRRSDEWTEPIANYDAIVFRDYTIELRHTNPDRKVVFIPAGERIDARRCWKELAQRLGLPAIEETTAGEDRIDDLTAWPTLTQRIAMGAVDYDCVNSEDVAPYVEVAGTPDKTTIDILNREGRISVLLGIAAALVITSYLAYEGGIFGYGHVAIAGIVLVLGVAVYCGMPRMRREWIDIDSNHLRISECLSDGTEELVEEFALEDIDSIHIAQSTGMHSGYPMVLHIVGVGNDGKRWVEMAPKLNRKSLKFLRNAVLTAIAAQRGAEEETTNEHE